jgi:hypothetical protein
VVADCLSFAHEAACRNAEDLPQLVGIKPKLLLRKFNDQKEEDHKNLPCV